MDDLEINDSVECAECGCVSTAEQMKAGDMQHWKDCPTMIDDSDFSGASDEAGFANDR